MAECSSSVSIPLASDCSHWDNCSSLDPSVLVNSFRLDRYFFQTWRMFNIRLLRTKSKLLFFRLAWCGSWTTMLEVTSGYSASENNFLWDCLLLAKFEFEAFDNRLKTGGLVIWKLQWQSESTAEMSCSQWHWGAIWWALYFLAK